MVARPPLHIVLFRPEIPQNTGNVGRLCAITGARLHLIHPLGFKIEDRHLRRSGMDYWKRLDLCEHGDWQAYRAAATRAPRLWMFTTRASRSFWDVGYLPGDGLLFGNEGHGCPDWLHEEVADECKVKIPHLVAGLRSLNLSTSVGIAAYEMLRQTRPGEAPEGGPFSPEMRA